MGRRTRRWRAPKVEVDHAALFAEEAKAIVRGSGLLDAYRKSSGLLLRAIIAGEYAVIGEETVGVGDELVDGEGRRFTVEEIQERRVVLREGGRRAEIGYARIASKGASAPAAGKGGRK
jgi:hypothetical protein